MTKKPKVAYLFGAGASCKAMPLLSGLTEALEKHANFIQGFRDHDPSTSPTQLREGALLPDTVDRYCTAMLTLAKNASAHASVDTYAKRLFLTDKRIDAFNLKLLLTTYFSYKQKPPAPLDDRYDALFASILTRGKNGFPQVNEDVMLLTWNYDLQLPLALKPYYYDSRTEYLLQGLGLATLDRVNERPEIPSVVHLNGIAAWRDRETIMPVIPDICANDLEQVMRMLDYFLAGDQPYYPGAELTLLHFAWENDARVVAGRTKLIEHLSECEVLVAIGYSFPFFNRTVDREIIGGMKSLSKVYLQSRPDGINAMVNAFKAIPLRDVEIETYEAVDKFMLPPEL
ncbi:MAG: hypothetical protein WBB32_09525 [Flavobacteriales bacterium]